MLHMCSNFERRKGYDEECACDEVWRTKDSEGTANRFLEPGMRKAGAPLSPTLSAIMLSTCLPADGLVWRANERFRHS